MNSKDNKGMCALVENGLYGGDDLELLDGLDLPDNLEGDECIEDWGKSLGPIPTDIFADVPSVTHVGDKIGNGNYGGGGGSMDFRSTNVKESFKSQLQQHSSTFFDERKMYRLPKSFEAPSPDSVLERLMATSSGKPKTIPLGPEVTIPVKSRTNRSRPVSTSNSWLNSLLLVPLEKAKKKRRLVSELPETEDKICTHCSTTQTPQWREGPMGPKTLCNACGVRYRSGRLLPEYRPAASPTFIPSLHSNSHRKVIEIRQKGVGIDGSPFAKKSRTAISYPVGAGKGFFLRNPTATTMSYPVGAGDGVFMKNPPIATMPYLVEARNGVYLKKPTAATVSYSVGAGDAVFVKKPAAATGPYSVRAGDGVIAKKPPYPVGAGDTVFMKQPARATATATIPFPAGAGYGVFGNTSMGSIPTLTRLGSD